MRDNVVGEFKRSGFLNPVSAVIRNIEYTVQVLEVAEDQQHRTVVAVKTIDKRSKTALLLKASKGTPPITYFFRCTGQERPAAK